MPYLSALEVCSRRGAIQIHVYLTFRLVGFSWRSTRECLAWYLTQWRASTSTTVDNIRAVLDLVSTEDTASRSATRTGAAVSSALTAPTAKSVSTAFLCQTRGDQKFEEVPSLDWIYSQPTRKFSATLLGRSSPLNAIEVFLKLSNCSSSCCCRSSSSSSSSSTSSNCSKTHSYH